MGSRGIGGVTGMARAKNMSTSGLSFAALLLRPTFSSRAAAFAKTFLKGLNPVLAQVHSRHGPTHLRRTANPETFSSTSNSNICFDLAR
jgi:hypothetical protein